MTRTKAHTIPELTLDADVGDVRSGGMREWLEAHGDGGFAMGTVSGAITRRYHGLFVPSLPARGRHVMVSKCDETAIVGGKAHRLAANLFRDDVHPGGEAVQSFALSPYPRWRLDAGGVTIERSVCAVRGDNATVVRYRHLGGPMCTLELRPFFSCRFFHHVRRGARIEDFAFSSSLGRLRVRAGDLPDVVVNHGGEIELEPAIWRDFYLPDEEARGLEATDDLFMPATIRVRLAEGEETSLVIALRELSCDRGPELVEREEARRAALVRPAPSLDRDVVRLVQSADAYVAQIASRHTIIAGFPWFEDWGRDTMIALPGLLLAGKRLAEAEAIMKSFADELGAGLLPNRFPDGASVPEFNTVDAALLYVEAARLLSAYTSDTHDIDDGIYEAVLEIVARYARGTLHGIGCDDDGLVRAASPHHALTWMDAVVDGVAVTPRRGKPVEIQALWFNALCTAADFAHARGSMLLAGELRALARRAQDSFEKRFWNDDRGYLADVVDLEGSDLPGAPHGPGTVDARLRPNQLFAVSLGHPILRGTRAASVVDHVRAKLLTPRGLRTLAPGDASFRPRFEGGPHARDHAYHQGTVWPWLLGPYCRAVAAVRGPTAAMRAEVRSVLEPLVRHALTERCVGQLAEVYDAVEPHRPAGCPAQAWSVAEVVRAWLEIVEERAPVRAAPHEPARRAFTDVLLDD